jgi:hypothetical protein
LSRPTIASPHLRVRAEPIEAQHPIVERQHRCEPIGGQQDEAAPADEDGGSGVEERLLDLGPVARVGVDEDHAVLGKLHVLAMNCGVMAYRTSKPIDRSGA